MKFGLSTKRATGKFPDVLPSPLKLNLGCGLDIRADYLNLDMYSDNPEVIYCDVRKLPLPDNSVDLILANDVLDIFSHREIDNVLNEWNRVLKLDGEIQIRVPNLKSQVRLYMNNEWDADVASYMLYGGQTNPMDYKACAFDSKSLSAKLLKSAFVIKDIQEINYKQNKGFINPKLVIIATKTNKITEISETKPDDNLIKIEFPDDTSNIEAKENSNLDKLYISSEIPAKQPIEEPIINNLDQFTIDENDIEIDKDKLENYLDYDDYDISLMEEIVLGKNKEETENINLQLPKYELNIVWEGSQFVYHSLALINREHCFNIIKYDVANLTIIPYEPDEFSYEKGDKYRILAKNDIRYKEEVSDEISRLPYCWIRHQWPPKAERPKGAKWIIMQPWEFSCLRQDIAEIFSQADEIWTPSHFSRNTFIESGIDPDKIQVIPNGIDPFLFCPNGAKYPLPTNKRLKLLFVGGTIYRKGIDLLLRAYIKAFTGNDDVCLVIKDIGTSSFYEGQTNQKMIDDIRKVANTPEIIYIDDKLEEEQMAQLYRACDVLVLPYRGEGFGLPVLEAMACGLPVIVTAGGATDDFVEEAFAWKIKATKKSIGHTLSGKPFVKEAFLLEPDLDELIETLKKLRNYQTNLKSMGMLAQYVARTNWTWERATLKLLSRLDNIYGTNMGQKAQNEFVEFSDLSTKLGKAESSYIAGDYENAKKLFLEALDGDYLNQEYRLHALHRLAIICINDDDSDYYKVINESDNIDSNHPDNLYVKTIKLASEGKNNEAIAQLSQLIENWENTIYRSTLGYTTDDLLVLLGDLLYAEGDLEKALNMYSSALKINNNNEYACYGAGKCFKESGINDHAKTMLEWAVKLNPDFEEAKKELAEL